MRRWAALVIIWGLGAVSGSMVGWTSALFTSTTSNPGNNFTAASSFCSDPGTQTVLIDKDTYLREDQPTHNFGGSNDLYVQSRDGARDRRTLISFSLPTKPGGCLVSSAILRLYANSVSSGRTIEAYRLASSPVWTEAGVNWNNPPPTSGTPATSPSGSTTGWKEWNVTEQVGTMYSSTNNGLLLKDQTENQPQQDQIYQSREDSPNDPQIVITFGPTVCSNPSIQTLVSTADSLVAEATPSTNYGTDASNYGVRSFSGGDARSFVSFALPSTPSGCSVTAADLRLYTSTGVTGRTLQAFQAAASWTETAVTWNTQPSTTGTAATAPSVASGWVDWTVTSIVRAMYVGANNGFLIRDATENAGSAQDQTMHPRENTNDPQLVVTFA